MSQTPDLIVKWPGGFASRYSGKVKLATSSKAGRPRKRFEMTMSDANARAELDQSIKIIRVTSATHRAFTAVTETRARQKVYTFMDPCCWLNNSEIMAAAKAAGCILEVS